MTLSFAPALFQKNDYEKTKISGIKLGLFMFDVSFERVAAALRSKHQNNILPVRASLDRSVSLLSVLASTSMVHIDFDANNV